MVGNVRDAVWCWTDPKVKLGLKDNHHHDSQLAMANGQQMAVKGSLSLNSYMRS